MKVGCWAAAGSVVLGALSFFHTDRPLIFAHRGGGALGPENTFAAFDMGMASGADGLELDVHLSKDGVAVVCHDDTLERTTDASGLVRALTAVELAQVDAGCRFCDAGGAYPFRGRGVTIPRLRDVLLRYPNARVIVEMKVDDAAMGLAIVEDIRESGAEHRVCAAGYGQRSMEAVRRTLPGLATSASHPEVHAALYRSWIGWPVRRPPYGGYQVPEKAGLIRVVSPRFIRHAHRAGTRVQVWTVDEEADMRRLLQWGVDGLISNRPDIAVRVRNDGVP